jgi:hypothetical protein
MIGTKEIIDYKTDLAKLIARSQSFVELQLAHSELQTELQIHILEHLIKQNDKPSSSELGNS